MQEEIQDAEHYPVENQNYLHMMNSADLDALFEDQNVQFIEKRAAGVFSLAGEDALNYAKADPQLWELILNKEIEFSKDPAYLHCGANLIYVGCSRKLERARMKRVFCRRCATACSPWGTMLKPNAAGVKHCASPAKREACLPHWMRSAALPR
jgi:hypothetical protein